MSPDEAVRKLFAAFADRDVDAAVAVTTPGVRLWPQGTLELTGRDDGYTGHDGLRRYLDDVQRGWRSLRVEPRDVRAAGDGAVVFGTVHGVTGDGAVVERQAIWVFKLHDGLVASVRAVGTGGEG